MKYCILGKRLGYILILVGVLNNCTQKKQEEKVAVRQETPVVEVAKSTVSAVEKSSGAVGERLAKDTVVFTGEHQQLAEVEVFNDRVKLRSYPEVSANVVATLKRRSIVTVQEKSAKDSIDNIPDYWYRVDAEGNVGYVWGRDLSLFKLKMDDKHDILFGLTSVDKNDYHVGKILVFEGESIVDQVTVTPVQTILDPFAPFNYVITGSVAGDKGLSGVKNILTVNSSYDACGYRYGDLFYFWNGKELIEGPTTSGLSEAGQFYSYETIQFPADTVGLKDKIIIKQMSGVSEEESEEMIEKVEYEVLDWDAEKGMERRKTLKDEAI